MVDPQSNPHGRNPPGKPRPRSGSADEAGRAGERSKSDTPEYRDRPADEGKHGDGTEEPNEGFPHNP
ncbi:MAG: hypothetical protein JWN85_242 [Gammaproteobacteria bacterium]|nr:hypothetical protein [Gammaproteobacteria bacterium]